MARVWLGKLPRRTTGPYFLDKFGPLLNSDLEQRSDLSKVHKDRVINCPASTLGVS